MSEMNTVPEPGKSDDGFSKAAEDAVEKWEKVHGKPKNGETITLRIVDMYVTIENPVRDYIVVLGSTG
jgi:hypothetical protein